MTSTHTAVQATSKAAIKAAVAREAGPFESVVEFDATTKRMVAGEILRRENAAAMDLQSTTLRDRTAVLPAAHLKRSVKSLIARSTLTRSRWKLLFRQMLMQLTLAVFPPLVKRTATCSRCRLS